MASSGYIYTQVLSEESSAQHGPFYVTNVLQVHHQDLKVGLFFKLGLVVIAIEVVLWEWNFGLKTMGFSIRRGCFSPKIVNGPIIHIHRSLVST